MGKPQKRTEEMQKLAVNLYEKLGSGNAVAKRLNVSPPTAYRLLRDAGVVVPDWYAPKPDRRKLDDARSSEVVRDYQMGLSLDEMQQKHDVNSWTIRDRVRKSGVKLRRVGGRKRELNLLESSEVLRLNALGLTQSAIAAKFGCHQTLISSLLSANGIQSVRHASGPSHGSWKGGISKNSGGYILQSPALGDAAYLMRSKSGYVPQHRLVMANYLGRPLLKSETVHHINGIKDDNRIENLQLRIGHHGVGVCYKCSECGSHKIEPTHLKD
jgi:transposase